MFYRNAVNGSINAKLYFGLLVFATTLIILMCIQYSYRRTQFTIQLQHPQTDGTLSQLEVTVQLQHSLTNTSNVSQVRKVIVNKSVDYKQDQGYLLSLGYEQQTTASFNTYTQLAKIAGLLNLSSVEPYAYKTGLTGIISHDNQLALKISHLYNFTHLKKFIKSCCANTDLKSFQEFLDNASQHVVLVSFVTSIKQHQFFSLKNKNVVVLDCQSLNAHSTFQTFNSLGETFSCSRIVFLDARPKHELPLKEIVDVLGSVVHEQVELFGSATVVLDNWKGFHTKPDTKYFSYISGFTSKCSYDVSTLEHSNLVISAANHFMKHFNLTQQAVGVHIRGERLVRDSNWNIEYSIDCLQKLHNFLHNYSVDDNSFPIVVFHDMGAYGSTSCLKSKRCINGRRKMLLKIKQLRLPVMSYDPSTFKSFPKSGIFASFVEREYLSHVHLLVTVGQGGFQKGIVKRFLNNSRETNLHRICYPVSPP